MTHENNDSLILVFVPALSPVLLKAEKDKGEPLTESEVIKLRDEGNCVAMTKEQAQAVQKERGYEDINPDNVWIEWQELRKSFKLAGSDAL